MTERLASTTAKDEVAAITRELIRFDTSNNGTVESGRERACAEYVVGLLKPASELDLHLTTMRTTGLDAVVHTHSYAATTVASLEGVTALPAVHYYISMFGGPDVRVADYAVYGSPELAANVAKALEGRTAALMSNHGSVVAGADLRSAYTLTLELEWVCELYLRTLAVGTPKILSDEQIETVARKIRDTGYGQSAPQEDCPQPAGGTAGDPPSDGPARSERLGVPGQQVGDARIGRRPPRLVVSNVTEVEAFSWSTVMRGSLLRAA